MVHYKVLCTAIVCLTLMEICAMYFGINGTMRTIIFMIIAGIVGVTVPNPLTKR
jgi:uncharacterized membrane protein YuzA (DUF378 family)